MCEIIFEILFSVVISFALIVTLDNVVQNSLNKKSYFIVNIFLSTAIYLAVYQNKRIIGSILLFIFLYGLCYINFKKKVYSLFSVCISLLLYLLSYFICGFIGDIIVEKQKMEIDILSYQYIGVIISSFFLSFAISYLLKQIFKSLNVDKDIFTGDSTNKVIVIVTFIVIIITALADGFVYLIIGDSNNMTVVFTFRNIRRLIILLNVIFIFIFFIFNVVILYFNNKNFEAKMNKQFKDKELARLKEYTKMIESLSDDLRRFKHDYFNIMEIIESYINENDMKALKDFYQKELVPETNKLKKNNKSIFMLKNLKVDSLKGLISSKLINAQSKGINTHVEILDDIGKINMSEIDLCRIIGIFLDNAIEASYEVDDPFINIYIIEKESSCIFVINNKCKKDTPPVYKLFEKGFSSKGENRGIGLSNVNKIISEKYNNVFLTTKIEKSTFMQEMIIKKDN